MVRDRSLPALIVATFILLAGLSMPGCTAETPPGENGNTVTPSGESLPPPKHRVDSKDIPSADKVFRIALLTNPPDLDPILISDTTSDGIAAKMFNTLLEYDAELNLVPGLTRGMPEVSGDRRTFTFRLKPGIKFHHGRELEAEDVRYSLNRLASIRSKRANLIEPIVGGREAVEAGRKGETPNITGIRVVDEHTVQIELVEPYYPFLYHLAMTNCSIVPKEVVQERGEGFSRNPTGTGPFRLVEWRENNFLRLERFDEYHEGRPKLAGIHYRVIKEPLARQEEYKAGNLDIIDSTQGQYKKWKDSNLRDQLVEWPQLTVQYYGFNLMKEGSPLAGYSEKARKLRLAFNHAVDRDHLCQNILEGRHFPSNGVIPRGMPGHDADRPVLARNPEKAKALLAEAGFPNGEGLPEIALWFNQQGDNAKIAQSVQQDLKQIGVNVTLKQLDWAAFIRAADQGEPAFFRLGWVADYPDPENFLNFLFHSRNHGPQGNVTFFSDEKVDRLIEQSHLETDPAKRLELLKEAEELVVEQVPWLFLTMQKESVFVKPYVRNFHPTPMDDDVACSQVPWHLVDIETTEP